MAYLDNLLIGGLLERFQLNPSEIVGRGDCFTNFLGLKTKASCFPRRPDMIGRIVCGVPNPSDGVYGTSSEYCAVLDAIESSDGKTFSMVELGAGWGPWVSAAGVICRTRGFKAVNLVAVEAAASKIAMLRDHFKLNGLDSYKPKVIEAAAWSERATLHFPAFVDDCDYGAGASEADNGQDYRGLDTKMVPVPALPLEDLCAGLGRIDLMHWDIQGAEIDVAKASTGFLSANVRRVYIGTHSREIEGALFALFHGMGWKLLWERPCEFAYDPAKTNLVSMTTSDGEQYWINPRLT